MTSQEITPRNLRTEEHDLIESLLRTNPRLSALLDQLPYLKVVEEYPGDDPSVILAPEPSAPISHWGDAWAVVEAEGKDDDGIPLLVFLHVASGYLKELEIVRADGGSIKHFPSAGGLKLLPPSGDRGPGWVDWTK